MTEQLTESLSALDVNSGDKQHEQLIGWLKLLAQWNKVCGLTAMPPTAWLEQLVMVSAQALPHLKPGTVLDVGSGAGVPGMVLAILAPDNQHTLVESNGKKANFLGHCRDVLGIDHLVVEHSRVETLAASPYSNIIARAFGSLSKLLELTWRLSDQQTRWLSFKGDNADMEMQALAGQKVQSRALPLQSLGSGRPGSLVLIDRVGGHG